MPIERYQVSLKVFLKNDEGKVLLLKNPSTTGIFAGHFDLPGGRIDVDELNTPFLDILRREISEEMGEVKTEIDPRPIGMSRATIKSEPKDIPVLFILFEGKYLGGDIVTNEEHEGYEWVVMEDLDLDKYFKPIHHDAMKQYFNKR